MPLKSTLSARPLAEVAEAHASPSPPGPVLIASLIGTTIEFYDFYIYALAAVLVFPRLFFRPGDPASASLQSFATYGVAFFARPVGSVLFGHFGDRVGRKVTLVAALLTMGISTVLIGSLPTYASIGMAAPVLLTLLRFGQGLGLGGEWGGAVLLATENAPAARRAWYGMFPQLGAPIGFLCSSATFLVLSASLDDAALFSWGWRIPFLASALLVLVGLYVRLRLAETADFRRAVDTSERVRLPAFTVYAKHTGALILGTYAATATFVLSYLMTVFSLSWATSVLHMPRSQVLTFQMIGMLLFALTIPGAALIADRRGRIAMLITATLGMMVFGLLFEPLLGSGTVPGVLGFLCLGLTLMGLTYGPLGAALAELFPTAVRYTGASMAFSLAGILGASLAPFAMSGLAIHLGLRYVGYYLSAASLLTLFALLLLPRPRRCA